MKKPYFYCSYMILLGLFQFYCSTGKMDQVQFQNYVLNKLKKIYPDIKYVKDSTPDFIKADDVKFGLQNLYRIYLENPKDSVFFKNEIKKYFNVSKYKTDSTFNLSKFKSNIRPQFMPQEYLKIMDLLYSAFCCNIVIGYVVDWEDHYQYITKKDFSKMNISIDSLNEIALYNLDSISKGVPMQLLTGESKMLVIGTGDGYDAIRILSPKIRDKIAAEIARDFNFAIPNRDFLICWPKTMSSSDKNKIKAQIEEDFRVKDHPLSDSIFNEKFEGLIKLQKL